MDRQLVVICDCDGKVEGVVILPPEITNIETLTVWMQEFNQIMNPGPNPCGPMLPLTQPGTPG